MKSPQAGKKEASNVTDDTFDRWHRIIRAADTAYLGQLTEGFEREWCRYENLGDASNAHANHSLLEICRTEMDTRRDSYTGETDS